jgi:tetraacyldisaccharide-1-P 4'-kinase
MLVVTRKTASLDEAGQVADRWSLKGTASEVATAIIHLGAGALELAARRSTVPEPERTRALASLRGLRALAISAIGAPRAFEEQLRIAGARVVPASYADHHAFTAADITNLARKAAGVDIAVCTLKDAVKLETRWPANAPPLWYLSQALTVERGEAILTDHLDRLVRADTP